MQEITEKKYRYNLDEIKAAFGIEGEIKKIVYHEPTEATKGHPRSGIKPMPAKEGGLVIIMEESIVETREAADVLNSTELRRQLRKDF
jgi:hypothetical protein